MSNGGQIWVIVASWVGAAAAWAGFWYNRRKTKEGRKLEMEQKYSDLFNARETFWEALREAYLRFRQDYPQAPEQIEGLIRAAQLPPDLLPRKGRDLHLWPNENKDKLGQDQRLLWEFASRIYPPREGKEGELTDYSFISREYSKVFHRARGSLAHFWEGWVPLMEMEYLCEHYKSADTQLIILSWLEIALLQWTRDLGEGKVQLFKLAQRLSKF